MTTLVLETDPVATHIDVDDERLTVYLADGRTVSVPLLWFPRLLHGSTQERSSWRLLGDGDAIEWGDLDEYIGVDGLLAGRKSGESATSLERWLAGRKEQGQSDIISLPEYRRQRGSDTWHWCPNCSSFPQSDAEVAYTKPRSGELCNECRSKDQNGRCA